nr:ABC transporter permease [Rhodococcus sp. 15-649-1-2]
MSISENTTPPRTAASTPGSRSWWPSWNGTSSVVAITAGLFVFSWLIAPGSVSGSAFDSLLPFAGILAIAAVGQTIVVMLKGIDLSLPGMMTLAALVSSKYAADHGSVVTALIIVACIAVIVGIVNGIVVSIFSVTPLVATLAMNAILLGVGLAYSGGTPTRAPQGVSEFALDKTVGISNTVWLAMGLVLVTVFATSRTGWGRRVVAVGSNERTARAAGVRTVRIKVSGYLAAALCYSGAGVLLAGYVSTPNTNAGNNYLLPAIAAVVVGGTALTGGRGNIVGTAIGALFLSQLTQLVLSMGAPSATQFLVQAAVIALAVGAQQFDFKAALLRYTRERRPAGSRS